MTPRVAVTAAVLGCMAVSGCEQTDRPPVAPALSLSVSAETVEEASNPTVQVTARLDSRTLEGVTVRLNFAGTATRDRDYAASSDAIVLAPNASSGSLAIDVYRDFDAEGDETVTAVVAGIEGAARVDGPESVSFDILDGESAMVDKSPPEGGGPKLMLLPFHFGATDDAVVLVVLALNASPDGQPALLVAEWSTDIDFLADVHLLGSVEIPALDDSFDFFFGAVHEFVLPLDRLGPDRSYFVRAYLGDTPPNPDTGEGLENAFLEGFATTADGRIRTRCEAPHRTPGAAGTDPLFAEQWHLVNTGQTAFSNRSGTAGADLRMADAIGAGHNGEGVKLAVVDTGLEICHPDLAANTAAGGSFNFAHESTPGASSADPFNHSILGDHGTSVAGIAAAVAGNGLGGRGVAPEVTLIGFNVGSVLAEDPETALYRSLGGSDRDPDSASVDIFNMSFGSELPSENATE
ncbi:MAG: S8 family serine peptidase, partial [Rhodospirillaceae bacterium]|nr:S8 family serine peptidase [Rhodospirillaceae bacterium]